MRGYRKLEYELLKVSAGFTSTELDYLQDIFESADRDRDGELNIKELLQFLQTRMIGSPVDTKEAMNNIAQLFARMDKDRSMTLNLLEFLRLLRVWSNSSKQGKRNILKVQPLVQNSISAFLQTRIFIRLCFVVHSVQ